MRSGRKVKKFGTEPFPTTCSVPEKKKKKSSNKLMKTVEGMIGTKNVPVVERRS